MISSKSKQVGSYLLSQGLSEMNSYVTEPPSLCLDDCSCLAYSNIPGTSIVEGHLVFRDPACLTPMSPSLDVEVYSQNLKNATMPSWKSFKNQFMEGLKPLKNALPSNRNLAAIDIISEVVGVCANFYRTKCMTYPKKVYGPYLQRNASLLPSFLYVGFLDKAPQIPIFGCLEFWKGAHHNNFFCVPRYKELHRMVTHHDAKTLMLWQISDSASLSFTGEYSRFSMLAGWTPLTNEEVAKATRIHSMFPASVVTRNLLKGLLGTMVKKLSLALPQGIHDIHIGGMHLQPLLPMPTRKRIAKRTTVLSEDPSEHPVRAGPDIGGEGPPQPDDRRSRTPRTPRPRPNSRRGRPPSRPTLPTPRDVNARPSEPLPPQNLYPRKAYLPLCQERKRKSERPHVPLAMILFKHKWDFQNPGAKVKIREVIRHGTHPLRPFCRKIGWCLTLLWKFAASLPSSIEIISMEEVKSFVDKLPKGESPNGFWGELDLVEMFPNIPREKVIKATTFFWETLCKKNGWLPRRSGFMIHKGGLRTLDKLSPNSTDGDFSFFRFNDVLAFLQWELLFNDRFVHFSSILKQTTGTAIGGTCSAQAASLTMLFLEQTLPKDTLPPLLRYRDNYLVYIQDPLDPSTPSLCELSQTLHRAIGMEVTVEGEGRKLNFLESCLCFDEKNRPTVSTRTHIFDGKPGDSTPPAHRKMLDAHSPNCPSMLESYVPNVIKKSSLYRDAPTGFAHNVCNAVSLFNKKEYPQAWWKRTLLSKASKIGLFDEANMAIRIAK